MIEKEIFVQAIESMMVQYAEDKKNSEIIGEMFGSETFNLYDNSKLYRQIIDLLSLWFSKEDIEHYCFVLNFGKIGEELETAAQFYDRLILNK